MKALHAIYMLIVFAASTTVATAQDYPEEYLGLPGDNLKIYRSNVNVVTTSYYDIAAWPLIRFIYHPGYSV